MTLWSDYYPSVIKRTITIQGQKAKKSIGNGFLSIGFHGRDHLKESLVLVESLWLANAVSFMLLN